MAYEPKTIMISGLDGKMAKILAEGILRVRSGEEPFNVPLELCEYGLTGNPNLEDIKFFEGDAAKRQRVMLRQPQDHDSLLGKKRKDIDYIIEAAKGEGVADRNAEMYAKYQIPFVMLSTGADYGYIDAITKKAGIPCVAYPNMDTRIVAWMYGIGKMSEDLPGAFKGAIVKLDETHQADKVNKDGKPETSGTMKQMLINIGRLTGEEMTTADIYSIRDPKVQESILEVPKEFIGWHAYHFFKFFDNHEMVQDSEELRFERHGGECYRKGAMRALEYLIKGNPTPGRHTMIDVMKAGF
jgi:hypothetical protein